ncbi:MAG: isochorismatase family protein [Collimonas sp.]|uniref:cysteine hydrolase family protein n=1 Tax=Collimonas sp. TaxID=1963772 RepID=UPI003266081A
MKALVVIDIQREYIAPGRLFQIHGIGPSLNNAYTMLRFARSQGWPIVHVKHLQDGDIFNRSSDKSDFIDGFVPEANEVLAIKGNYSSYSSEAFTKFVADHPDHELVVIGYGTTMCCLSTIVDGYHRGQRFALVEDACAALAVKDYSEEAMHEHAVAILGRFARITRTADATNVQI